jgi:tetratricopeptide (TPR) repeat protein
MSREAYSALPPELQKSINDSGTSTITRDFEQIIEAAPSVKYYLELGLGYAQRGNAQEAAQAFQRGLSLDPKNIPIRLEWSRVERSNNVRLAFDLAVQAAGLSVQLQRIHDARLIITEVLDLPGMTSFQRCTGLAYLASFEMRQKQVAAAFTTLDEARSICPEHPLVLMVLGQLQFMQGEYAKAERTLQDAVKAAEPIVETPNWLSRALASRATFLAESGRYSEAEVLFARAISSYRSPEALAAYAYFLALKQEIAQADQLIEEAVSSAPASAEVHYLYGQVLEHKRLLAETPEKALLSEWEELWTAYSDGSSIDIDRCQLALHRLLAKCNCHVSSPFASIENRFVVAELDISRIFDVSEIPPRVLVVVMMRSWTEKDSTLLLEMTGRQGMDCVIIFLFDEGSLKDTIKEMRERFEVLARHLAILTYLDVRYFLLRPKSADALRRRLLMQFQIQYLSPYQAGGPVTGRMFVGRDREMKWIYSRIGHTNVALVGGRRIGKTTILRQLEWIRLRQAGFVPYYYDCSTSTSFDDMVKGMANGWLSGESSQMSRAFDQLLLILTQSVSSPVVLLDEVDRLIAWDRQNDFPFLRAARGFSNLNKCHFVLSGERVLQAELESAPPGSPLYNFGEKYIIGCLDKPAVVELVKLPMQQLGIELIAADEITGAIWEYTSGQPYIVQWICQQAVIKLEREKTRLLRKNDIEDIVMKREFVDTFVETVWERSTALERICAYTMALDQTIDSESLLYDALVGHGLEVSREQVDAALKRLADLRGILDLSEQKCEFAMPAFFRVTQNIRNLDYRLSKWIDVYNQHGDIVPEARERRYRLWEEPETRLLRKFTAMLRRIFRRRTAE